MTGRPRDTAVDEAILRATFEMVEQGGYRGLSIEGIAARSGVTKQTIYRRYRNKGEVMLDVLAKFAADHLPNPDTGSLRGDLTALLRATFPAQQGASGQLNRALAIEALQDEEFARLLWDRLIRTRREVVRTMLAKARVRGEVTHPDDDFLIDQVYGAMWYRLLFGPSTLDEAYADRVVESVLSTARLHAPANGRSTERAGR